MMKTFCIANGWLEEQDHKYFYRRIFPVERHWTKCISLARDHVEK